MMHHKPDPSSLIVKYAISTHRFGMLSMGSFGQTATHPIID